MTEREMYLRMAEWLREHGFSALFETPDGCGCFLHAAADVLGRPANVNRLRLVIGTTGFGFYEDELRDGGWTDGCTDDAVAACLIAADLATPTPVTA